MLNQYSYSIENKIEHRCNEKLILHVLDMLDTTIKSANLNTEIEISILERLDFGFDGVFDAFTIDIYEVIKAAATKPFGFSAFYPGPGLGGHCIPIDPYYLTWKAKQIGIDTKFIELAGEINTKMPKFVISKIKFALKKLKIKIEHSNILILGIAYKKNIDDTRESPALKIIYELYKLQSNVQYCDPYINQFPKSKKINLELKSKKLTKHVLKENDIVVLITDHDSFNYNLIKNNSKIIIDTRGRFTNNNNIIRA